MKATEATAEKVITAVAVDAAKDAREVDALKKIDEVVDRLLNKVADKVAVENKAAEAVTAAGSSTFGTPPAEGVDGVAKAAEKLAEKAAAEIKSSVADMADTIKATEKSEVEAIKAA